MANKLSAWERKCEEQRRVSALEAENWNLKHCSPKFDDIDDYATKCAARAKAIREVIKVI